MVPKDNHLLKAYPNPAREELYVSFNEQELITEVIIYDMLGRAALQKINTDERVICMDMSAITKGTYMLFARNRKISCSQKIVVIDQSISA